MENQQENYLFWILFRKHVLKLSCVDTVFGDFRALSAISTTFRFGYFLTDFCKGFLYKSTYKSCRKLLITQKTLFYTHFSFLYVISGKNGEPSYSENTNIRQVVIARGYKTGLERDSIQWLRLGLSSLGHQWYTGSTHFVTSPSFFSNPDSYISGNFTISLQCLIVDSRSPGKLSL